MTGFVAGLLVGAGVEFAVISLMKAAKDEDSALLREMEKDYDNAIRLLTQANKTLTDELAYAYAKQAEQSAQIAVLDIKVARYEQG